MATVTYHQTEDSAATVHGKFRAVVVIDNGYGGAEVMEPPKSATRYTRYGAIPEDWSTVKELPSYSAAIDFAGRYVDQPA